MFFTKPKLVSIRAPKKAAPKKAVVASRSSISVGAKEPLPVKKPESSIYISKKLIIKANEPAKSAPVSNTKSNNGSIKLNTKKIIINGVKANEPAKSAPVSNTQSNNGSIKLNTKRISIKV